MSSTVLGIDPGLRVTGYAILRKNGTEAAVREAGIIKTNERAALGDRLKTIYEGLNQIIVQFRPDALAVEKLYSHYRHPQTAVTMGHARGVVFLSAANHGLPVLSYASTRIKKSLTGSGRASKRQVQTSVAKLLNLEKRPDPTDVADAIAVALCHLEAQR